MQTSYASEMIGHSEQCVDIYCELTVNNTMYLNTVATPCIYDHLSLPYDFTERGVSWQRGTHRVTLSMFRVVWNIRHTWLSELICNLSHKMGYIVRQHNRAFDILHTLYNEVGPYNHGWQQTT